jgi:hypothetical protein
MASCSKLEEIANKAREEHLMKNNYAPNDKYSSLHPNATQAQGGIDDPNNVKGREPINTFPLNTNGAGNDIDINGIPALGYRGRSEIFIQNLFNPQSVYNCVI